MFHEPAPDHGDDAASRYKSRLGVVMFLIYCVVYAGFVLVNVVAEGRAMQTIVVLGLNLAVVYGMGLIIFALLLALIYNFFCTRKENQLVAGPAPAGSEVHGIPEAHTDSEVPVGKDQG